MDKQIGILTKRIKRLEACLVEVHDKQESNEAQIIKLYKHLEKMAERIAWLLEHIRNAEIKKLGKI